MKITPSLVAVIVVVALVLVVVLKFWGQGGILPPHEFAYGTALRNSDVIAERMNQFLSLQALDPKQVQIQTYVGNNSAKKLSPLISYISSQRGHGFGALVAALKEVDQLPDQKEKAIRRVKAEQQDSVVRARNILSRIGKVQVLSNQESRFLLSRSPDLDV